MDTSPDFPVQYFPFIFIGLWLFISLFISLLSGWWSLSQNYRFRGKFIGKKFYMKSLRMRFMSHYNSCVNIGVNSDGLYFSVFPFFRFAHPPLFIPWYDVQNIEETKDLFIFKFYKIRFKQNPGITMTIGKRLGDKIFNDYRNKIPATSTLIR